MKIKSFHKQASEAIKLTTEGLELLIELCELQEAVKSLPKNEAFEQMLKEIIEKEKKAIALIQKSTWMQRELIKKQHEAMESLILKLD